MPASPSNDGDPGQRQERVRQIVFDVMRRRSQGERVPDEEVFREFPDLAEELGPELAKVRRVMTAVELPDESKFQRGLDRLQHDWQTDFCDSSSRFGSSEFSTAERVDRRPSTTRPPSSTVDRSVVRGDAPDDVQMIDRYCVIRQLGVGGFGRVYLARDEHLAREVAIKVPHRQPKNEQEYQTFLGEARAAAGIDHPAIVPVYDAGRTTDGECYVVTKVIKGKDLSARIRRRRLGQVEAASIVVTIARALHHAHTCGFVHRDIKPSNILIDDEFNPYLADFGLALNDRIDSPHRSQAGTPAYMSPEQARGESHRVEPRSDIFSLGIVFYELLTGRKPFVGSSSDELMEQIIWSEPPLPQVLDESIPDELQRICLKALAKRAQDRFSTALAFAEDLQFFLNESQLGTEPAPPPTEPSSQTIVPKGLRSFDAEDAEFFTELVPGRRDRDGLPECIRQWKTRIESTNPDQTFNVGLIYGPSGCGKSSLVCAGLLPRLTPNIQTIYLTASPDETEECLLGRLLRVCPKVTPESDLVEVLSAVRRGRVLGKGQKMLIVIDQFEQWLHGRSADQRRSLIDALRQCDGERLQCLLLVRDDFWLAISRFMGELEIDLVQGDNAALVDLFDVAHARKVLACLGHAFGHLPHRCASLDPVVETFIRRAIDALAEEGKVAPVRLALFAEMVRSQPWTPATLRKVGGPDGIGVAFLEETFSARTANPQNRFHEKAARGVLEALLPEPRSPIQSHSRSYAELLEVSGYGRKPQAFKALMRILDETRLITPTDSSDGEAPSQRYYQLTHDYLVPALRAWLTRKQKTTISGRAELILAERSMMWSAKRERRQLPSLREWAWIRFFGRSSQWTDSQKEMMRSANRYHLSVLAIGLFFVTAFWFAGKDLNTLRRNLVTELKSRSAVVSLAFGRKQSVWDLLKSQPDPTIRTNVIHGLSLVVTDPVEVVEDAQHQSDPSVAQGMLLIAGELVADHDSRPNAPTSNYYASESRPIVDRLWALYHHHPDPAVHAAAEWTIRQFNKSVDFSQAHASDAVHTGPVTTRWYCTHQGHTMVKVDWPEQFSNNGPLAARSSSARQLLTQSFYVADREITRAQFRAFAEEWEWPIASDRGHQDDHPQTHVTWHAAAAYCNWLSEKEGLSPNHWCYVQTGNGEFRHAPAHLSRRGYRLPTEFEWEYACLGNAQTDYHFGNSSVHLREYAAFTDSSLPMGPELVGRRKPNQFGLFDMHGNVAEWCDLYPNWLYSGEQQPSEDAGSQLTLGVVRGGSYWDSARGVRSQARSQISTHVIRADVGFRVVASALPESSPLPAGGPLP